MKRMPLLMSLLAVVALAASIAYWVLQLYQPAQRPLAAAPPQVMAEPAPDAAATLFGGQAVAMVATNYQLTGVVAAGREGVAILVADGQPPRALKVGKDIAPGVSLVEVHARHVMLSEGGVLKRIELATDATAGPSLTGGMPQAQMQQSQMPPQQDMPAPDMPAPQMAQPTPMPATPMPPQQLMQQQMQQQQRQQMHQQMSQQNQQNQQNQQAIDAPEPDQQLPQGVPPPPPPPMQTPTRNFSQGAAPPNQ